jgi:hypothetical protein
LIPAGIRLKKARARVLLAVVVVCSSWLNAATAIGTTYSAAYDAAGDMSCRAPSSAATCSGVNPSGAQLTYDAEGRLALAERANKPECNRELPL